MTDIHRIAWDIFEGEGNSQEKLKRIFNKKISYNNSAMYIAGMKLLLEKLKDSVPDDFDGPDPDRIYYHTDKSRTLEEDVYLTRDEAASPSVVLNKMGLDPLLWEVMSFEVLKGHWDTTMKMENQKIVNDTVVKTTYPLTRTNRKYHVKIRVKPLASELKFPQVLDAFRKLDPENIKDYKYDPISYSDGLLLEMTMMDFHLGKHAWNEESGDDYDLKIAEELWCMSIEELLEKNSRFGNTEQILFPVGQDFFHFDTPGITTTSGTQLNSDSRWQKVFRKGIEVLVWGIEKCREVAPVEVLWVPGNHDQMLSYAATVGLAQRYANSKTVNVDLISAPRKYRLFGKNLIGYSHGEKEKKRIEGLMQLEAPEDWGKSRYREFHLGHLHSESSDTKNGIIFRRISSITGTDAWHSEHGFIGATRQAQAFLWHKELGLQAIFNSNIIKEIGK